jgi:hypothetical protein
VKTFLSVSLYLIAAFLAAAVAHSDRKHGDISVPTKVIAAVIVAVLVAAGVEL